MDIEKIDETILHLTDQIDELKKEKESLLKKSKTLGIPEKDLNSLREKSYELFHGRTNIYNLNKYGVSVKYRILWDEEVDIPAHEIIKIAPMENNKNIHKLFKLINSCGEWDNPYEFISGEFFDKVPSSKESISFKKEMQDVLTIVNRYEQEYDFSWYDDVVLDFIKNK